MRKFTLTLLLAVIVAWTVSVQGAAAAPHILGERPEPATAKVGRLHAAAGSTARAFALGFTDPAPATVKVLLLRVDFPADLNAATTGSGTWDDAAYGYNNDPDFWINQNRTQLIDYYAKISGGLLTLTVDISPQVYRMPNPMANYGTETAAAIENLIVDAVTVAGGAGQSFAGYDVLILVHAGAGEETDIFGDTSGDIWSLYYSDSVISANNSSPTPLQVNGANLTEAILMPQTGSQDGTVVDSLGIYAHEFGHFLGLPDLYPTSASAGWVGVGSWCLMGDGAYNRASAVANWGSSPAYPSAWCRAYLGWETPQQPAAGSDLGTITLSPIAATLAGAGGTVRLVQLPDAPTAVGTYFLVENRQRADYDIGLAGHGLLVWKIDEGVINSNLYFNTVNNNPNQPGVALVEADGDSALLTGIGFASGGDPFPGSAARSALTPTTQPVSSITAHGDAWVNLKGIAETGTLVTTAVGFGPQAVGTVTATVTNGVATLDWEPVVDSTLVGYNVYRNGALRGTTVDSAFVDSGAATTDSYAVASVDAAGNETLSARRASPTPVADPAAVQATPSLSGGGGGCFIATAAYGSYEAPAVKILRQFRDRVLLRSAPGTLLVRTYYRISPPLAEVIADSAALRGVVRVVLLPAIALAACCVVLTPAQQLAAGVLLLLPLGVVLIRRRRPARPT